MSTRQAEIILRHLRKLAGPPPGEADSDRELLRRFAARRDEAAFELLVRRHGPMVLGVCRRVLHDGPDSEDAFQGAFLVLARKAGSLRWQESVASWLHRVAYHIALRAGAAARRRRLHEARAPVRLPSDPAADITLREAQALLDEELARLPEKYRAPLVLCCLEATTRDAAARRLGWSLATLKRRLARGRELLRERLARRGLTLSAALAGSLLDAGTSPAVPPALVEATGRAALAFAGGQAAAGVVSAPVVALAEGGLRTLSLGKLQILVAGLLMLVLGGGVTLLLGKQAPAPVAEVKEAARTDLYGDPLPAGAVLRLGTLLFRHEARWIKTVAFSADGKVVLSTAEGTSLRFFDAATGRPLDTITTEDQILGAVALSPDGRRIVSAGTLKQRPDGTRPYAIRIWDAVTHKALHSITLSEEAGLSADPLSLALTPDGKTALLNGPRGTIHAWDLQAETELLRYQLSPGEIRILTLSPDGKTVAAANTGDVVYLWEWQAGKEPRKIKLPEHQYPGALAFSPDGKMLAVGGGSLREIYVWDVASGRLRRRLARPGDYGRMMQMAFSPDGKALAVSRYSFTERGYSGGVDLWDPAAGIRLRRLSTPGESVSAVAISRDSRRIAARTMSGVHVWDPRTGEEFAPDDASHRGEVTQLLVSRRGLIATSSDDETVRLWDAETGKQRLRLRHGHWVRGIALSPDGTKLASASLDDAVHLWDTRTGREIYRLPGHGNEGGSRSLAFTRDGQRFLSFGDDLYLRVWDVRTGKALVEHALRPAGIKIPDEDAVSQLPELGTFINEAVFTSDGKTMLLGTRLKFHVYDVTTGKELRTFDRLERFFTSLTLSPDGKYLLASALGQNTQTRLPNGKTLITEPVSHPVYLVDMATGKEVRRVLLPGSEGWAVAFSPDGKLFAATADPPRGQIKFWDAATGAARGTIEGVPDRVRVLTFSPDGKQAITALRDTSALVWDVTKVLQKKP